MPINSSPFPGRVVDSDLPPAGQSLPARLFWHARHYPNQLAVSLLEDSDRSVSLTFRQLADQVTRVAGHLQTRLQPGERAILVYPTSLEFVVSFLACLATGIIAVPTSHSRTRRRGGRLQGICASCQPRAILTARAQADTWDADWLSELGQPEVIATDALNRALEPPLWQPNEADSLDRVAMLQYTSGSTSEPKGVILTHRNIVTNLEQIIDRLGHNRSSKLLSWLPMFHDMGLFGGMLPGLYLGFPVYLMAPERFLRAPQSWLEAITRYRITATGGPNFAFQWCTAKIPAAIRQTLDLSSIEVMWCAAEPINAETLEEFSTAFLETGFTSNRLYPSYGLAEATLGVSGGPLTTARIASLDAAALEQGVWRKPTAAISRSRLVSCGQPCQGIEVVIVDPNTRQRVAEDQLGEIWVRSAAVAAGYWRQAEATRETFENYLPDGRGPFLATGDLGFFRGGELYVAGRRKDVIICRGRNLYPQDLERAVEPLLAGATANRVGAFGWQTAAGEAVGLLLELDRETYRALSQGQLKRAEELVAAARTRILEEFEAPLAVIGLAKPGSFPRTSSGKVQRRRCRQLLEQPSDDIVYSWTAPPSSQLEVVSSNARPRASEGPLDPAVIELSPALERLIGEALEAQGMAAPQPIPTQATLAELGLDSLAVQALLAAVEKEWQVSLSATGFDGQTPLCQLAERLAEYLAEHPVAKPHWDSNPPRRSNHTASSGSEPARRKDFSSPVATLSRAHSAGAAKPTIDSRETSLSDLRQFLSPDLFTKAEHFASWNRDFGDRGFRRFLLPVKEYRGGRALVGSPEGQEADREVKVFCSADYLDLSQHPKVIAAGQQALASYGASVSSVPLIAGLTDQHYELERRLAAFLGTEACVLFPTGLSANTATIAALCSESDFIVVDNQVHYSILEGVKLSGAAWRSFAHSNPASLEQVLRQLRREAPQRGILVVLEGVYGIDGDAPPLAEFMATARRYGARVLLDDAHALGVMGSQGRGTSVAQSAPLPDLLMGSLSKSLGSFGGFIAASREVVEYLRYYAKAIVFAVGLPTVNVATALAALDLLEQEPQRITRLRANAAGLRSRLVDLGWDSASRSQSAIMSALIGDEGRLKDLVRDLFQAGVWAEGLPFPAVSRGQERLRFRARSSHTERDLDETAEALGRVAFRLGWPTRTRVRGSGPAAESSGNESTVSSSALELASNVNADEIVELMIAAAAVAGQVLPWINPVYARRWVARSEYWHGVDEQARWFVSRDSAQRLVAALFASVNRVHHRGGFRAVGHVGHIAWLPGAEAQIPVLLNQARAWLPPELPCSAPAQFPVQVLGAGCAQGFQPLEKPLFESTPHPQLGTWLVEQGWQPARVHRYQLWHLAADGPNPTLPELAGLEIRPFRREHLAAEVQAIWPLFNATIGQLEGCGPLSCEQLQGLVADLRDLILPGFCWLAEQEGEIQGFFFAFPNVVEAFARAEGRADIADLEDIRLDMERAETGFLAWMGVTPSRAGQGLGQALASRVLDEMRARGMRQVWTSWELVDGPLAAADLLSPDAQLLKTLEYQLYEDAPRGDS